MDAMLTYIAIAIFILVGTGIAWLSKRFLRKEAKDFYAASGRFGTVLASLSYAATTYSAFMFIGLVGMAYATGVGTLGFELVYLVGTLFLLYYIAPKYWTLHKKYGYITPAEVLSDRYGSGGVGVAVTLLSLVALIPYAASQVIGVAVAAEGASSGAVTFSTAVVIAIAVALLWAAIAGIWSVGLTDVFQGIVMVCTGVIMVCFVYWQGFGQRPLDLAALGSLSYVPSSTWTFANFVNMTLPWFFFAITNPQVVQRLFAPKTKEAQRGMITWFGIYGITFTVIVTLLGLMLRLMTADGAFPLIANRDAVTPTLLSMLPAWLSIMGLVAVIAASVSTIDGIILTLSSMTVRDVLRRYAKGVTQKAEIAVARITIVAIAIACTIFALSKPGFIVDLAVLSSSLLLPQVPVVIGMFVWCRGGKWTAVATIVAGFGVALALYLLKASPLDIPANVWTIAASTLVYVAAAAIEGKTEGAARFVEA
jgi:SSS family solute:Na+ symporter